MDKQKQIQTEELIGIIQGAVGGCATHWASLIAEEVLKYYQPKIPENAVVLTREEYNKLEKKIADLSYDAHFHKHQEERIVDLQYDKFELMNEISEKDNKIKLLEETIECIKFNVNFTRKETAEKFAKLVEFHSVSTRDEEGREIFTISALGLKEILHEEFGIPYEELTEGNSNDENGD